MDYAGAYPEKAGRTMYTTNRNPITQIDLFLYSQLAEWRGGYLKKTLEKRHNNDMGSNPVLTTIIKVMSQQEIKMWIDKWSRLRPSPQRDMVIKIWSKGLRN